MSGALNRRDVLKGLLAATAAGALEDATGQAIEPVTLILKGGKVTTLDPSQPDASALAIAGGRFVAVGDDGAAMKLATSSTRVIDLGGRRVIPGLMDSHTHLIRGGLSFNMELRWDGVPSLAEALRMLKEQVRRTPPPQWVRVVGGFSEYQFAERRMPTLAELNAIAPETPVFILRLYDRALLNRAALRAVGYTRETPDPPGGFIERDRYGEPTGLLMAKPNAALLYATLGKGPRLSFDDQTNSTRQFMRELNRLGVTAVIDAGGGSQSYPQDYEVIERLAQSGNSTVRISYNLFPQRPREELDDFETWARRIRPGQGNGMYRHNGAGEMLVYSAADFEDFRQPRPELASTMEAELERVVRHLANVRWPFRLHATYDETIDRALDVFEKVHRDVPLDGSHWFLDHAETISPRNIDRVVALGGGIAVQHRMAYQGEDFARCRGNAAAANAPPLGRMLAAGVPLGAGTDATRVASYNPWVCIHWLVTGRTVGGLALRSEAHRVDRTTALRLWSAANTWFSNEQELRGTIRSGQLADLAVLSADLMTVRDEAIKDLGSVLTVVGGRVVHGEGAFAPLAPPLPPASPDWSPVNHFGADRKVRHPAQTTVAVASRECIAHASHTGWGCDCGFG